MTLDVNVLLSALKVIASSERGARSLKRLAREALNEYYGDA